MYNPFSAQGCGGGGLGVVIWNTTWYIIEYSHFINITPISYGIQTFYFFSFFLFFYTLIVEYLDIQYSIICTVYENKYRLIVMKIKINIENN